MNGQRKDYANSKKLMTKPTYYTFPFIDMTRMSYFLDTERVVFAMGCESERRKIKGVN